MQCKKLERALEILNLIQKHRPNYQILDGDDSQPWHVRIDGFGDVWPATGTYRIGKEIHRNDVKGLIRALTGNKSFVEFGQPTISQRVQELEEYCSWLENRLSELESRL